MVRSKPTRSAKCSSGTAAAAAEVASLTAAVAIRQRINRWVAGQVAETVCAGDLEDLEASNLVVPADGTQVGL